jgi:hypothetical protein
MRTTTFFMMTLLATAGMAQWTNLNSGSIQELSGVAMLDPEIAWAFGSNATLLNTADGGGTWSGQTTTTPLELTDVATGYGTGSEVGAGGAIVKPGETMDAVEENGLLLYPNPSSGDVNIAIDGHALQGLLTIEVRTADGRIVDRASTEPMTRPARMFGMTPGHYVVTVTDATGASLRRNLIVQAH